MKPAHVHTLSTGAKSYLCLVRRRQDGAIAIMTALLLLLIVAFFGLAIDLAMLYNRKVELQNVADAIALAAANELNGYDTGITKAVAQAAARFSGSPPSGLTYRYGTLPMNDWSEDAIRFSSLPSTADSAWRSVGDAKLNAAEMLYVKVDTSKLNGDYSRTPTFFIHLLSQSASGASTSARAVAGRASIKVAPLAVCALRPERARNRSGELVEYGFRRGVGYDLMNLNPDSATEAAKSFLINPWAPPGTAGSSPSLNLSIVTPYVCSGTMPMPRVSGGTLTVDQPFPIADMVDYLNSRFDSSTSTCNAYTAPPDSNVKPYPFSSSWMKVMPGGQTAAELFADGKRWTVADPEPSPPGTTDVKYGVLWSYAKAAKYSSYSEGVPEPAAGYATFAASKTDWAALYSPGAPEFSTYPTPTPYVSQLLAPPSGRKGVRGRRVLNVPLLSCTAGGGGATVLGIGKFFMTVPATSSSLYAEFAGVVAEQSLGGPVELYP